jgi:predicted transcriptional regulator
LAPRRTGRGRGQEVLAFESWEGLARVLTGERFRLLRHVHASPAPSISALARSLDRQYRRVHADVTALEQAGLLERSADGLRTTGDCISLEIRL